MLHTEKKESLYLVSDHVWCFGRRIVEWKCTLVLAFACSHINWLAHAVFQSVVPCALLKSESEYMDYGKTQRQGGESRLESTKDKTMNSLICIFKYECLVESHHYLLTVFYFSSYLCLFIL